MATVHEDINTQLRTAASNDDLDHVRRLLVCGANPQATDDEGYTALHWAALWSTAQMATLLIRHGAPPNAATYKGNTPLHFAIRRKDEKIIEALRRGGADPHQRNVRGISPHDQSSDPGLRGLLNHVFVPETPSAKAVARHFDIQKVACDTPTRPSRNLLPNWHEVRDEDGNPYYWNTATDVTTRNVPTRNVKQFRKAVRWPTVVVDNDEKKEPVWHDKGEDAWNTWKKANAALLGMGT